MLSLEVLKLVDSATTVRPFLRMLLPGLIKIKDTIGDPSARGVVERTIASLHQVGEVPTGDGTDLPLLKTAEASSLANTLVGIYKKAGASSVPSTSDVVVVHVSRLSAALIHNKNFDNGEWQSFKPYPALVTSSLESATTTADFMVRRSEGGEDEVAEDGEEGEELCNCTFSLVYGAQIQLNIVTLCHKRGHRYGLCDKNGTR